MDDLELLRAYADQRNQDAFAELVRRHGGWVYAAARRQLGDGQLAEDITQAVFMLLAQRARKLRRHTYLSGWLFLTAGYCVREMRRQRGRAERREREVAMMRPEKAVQDAAWEEIAPLLEDAVGRLGRLDRDAVLLRFYEQKPLAEVGRLLGVSEDAAQKRVERAVGKLRQTLTAQGVQTQTFSLAGLVLAHVAGDAPAGLAARVTTMVAEGMASSSAGGIAQGAVRMMMLTKLKVAAAAGLLAAAMAVGAAQVMADKPGASSPAPAVPTAVGTNPDWQTRFNALYRLEEGQVLKYIPAPFSPDREQYFRAKDKSIAQGRLLLPDGVLFHWDGKSLRQRLQFGGGRGQEVDDLLPAILDLQRWQYEGPTSVLSTLLPHGDFIVRSGSSEAQRLAAFREILRQHTGRDFHFGLRNLDRDVIVARGRFALHPLSPDDPRAPAIQLSTGPAETIPDDIQQARNGGRHNSSDANVEGLLTTLGSQIGRRVVDETDRPHPQEQVPWSALPSSFLSRMPEGDERNTKTDLLLAVVTQQTNLSFIRERRNVPVWVISELNARATPEALGEQFVQLMSAGALDEARQLFLTREEFRTLFEGPNRDALYDQLQAAVGRSLNALAEQMRGAQFVRMNMQFAPAPFTVQRGKSFGPVAFRIATQALDNTHVIARFQNGKAMDIKLDEMVQLNGQWKLMNEVRVQYEVQER